MSMRQGRGGMGSHKHGISGHAGLPPGLKQCLAREENKRREKTSHRQRMYESVPELMRERRARPPEKPIRFHPKAAMSELALSFDARHPL